MTNTRKRKPLVLHIEDYAPTQYLRSEILSRGGYRVSNVSTIRDAMAAAALESPDVILCDVKLPDGTGFQICREMRTVQPDVPVILISAAHRDEFAQQTAVFTGAAEYLVEPVAPEELVAAIKRHIR
jgi:DNA-binding response OmpR family regulator